MKRILSILLSLTICLTLFPAAVQAQAASVNDLYYEIMDGQVTITGCKGSASGNLTIPDTIAGCPVTSIGDRAFSSCSWITSVTIGDGVTSIGKYAFSYCYNLADIIVSENNPSYSSDSYGVLYTKDKAILVQAPHVISGTYIIPDGVTSIGDYAFEACYRLTSVTIPASVTSIGDRAFYDCYDLTNVTIPASVSSIGNYAFASCSSLTSVTIPDSVTSIGNYAFSSCSSLTGIIVSENNPSYSSDSYGVLYTKDKAILVQAPGAISGAYIIPASVTSIGDKAFYSCDSLTSVTIGGSVTSIGDYAFFYCNRLTSVTVPDSVTSIGNYAFGRCDGLTSVTIPDSVTSIGDYTFFCCGSLTSVTIPASVTSIGDYAFSLCDSLTSVEIPDSVTSIGDYAFYSCDRLTSVTIPASVTSIGDYAFSLCDSLTSVEIPDSVTSIGDYAFYSCDRLTSMTIPASVTSIGNYAFSYCSNLAGIIVSENNPSYSSDPYGVLYTKDKAALVQAPGAISGTYTIPNSVTSIGDDAFCNCSSLTSIYFAGNAPSIANGAFGKVYAIAYYHAGTSGWANAAPEYWTGSNGQITLQEVDHIWSSFTYDNNHTCTEDGTERAVCLTCGEADIRKVEGTAAHQYVNGICIFCNQLDPSFTWAELTGKLTVFGKGAVQLTLTPVGETTPAATQTTTDGSYSFQMAPGDYILTVSQEGTVPRTYTVTLTEGQTALDVKLQPLGDVTGDGKVNVMDVAKLYAHIKGMPITDEYALTCGDTTGDGTFNILDVAKLYAHIKSQ